MKNRIYKSEMKKMSMAQLDETNIELNKRLSQAYKNYQSLVDESGKEDGKAQRQWRIRSSILRTLENLQKEKESRY